MGKQRQPFFFLLSNGRVILKPEPLREMAGLKADIYCIRRKQGNF